jgi:hypothetical protein
MLSNERALGSFAGTWTSLPEVVRELRDGRRIGTAID